MALNPRESGEFIAKNASYVKVNDDGINALMEEVLKGLKDKTLNIENFSQNTHHPSSDDSWAPDWLFVIDTLNFCFWTAGNNTKWRVNNETGYFALCAAINRALKEGIDITNPKFYSKITLEQLKDIFRSDDGVTTAPLLQERVDCLHQVGTKLLEKYDGTFVNCIKACNNSSQKLLNLIVTEFPCFKDEANYKGKTVAIYKRVQILIGDIWSCYQGKGLGRFDDIDTITMFADYRIPQVLVHFKAMEYTKELMDILEKDQIMKNGDEMEVEIRGISIYVVEELKNKLLKEIEANHPEIDKKPVNSILLDHFLWDYRRRFAKELECIPFHKVLSIYY